MHIVFLQVTDVLNARLAQNGINVISNGLLYINDDVAESIITSIQVGNEEYNVDIWLLKNSI